MSKIKSRSKRKKLYFDSLTFSWQDYYITRFRKTNGRYPNRKEL